MAVIAADEAKPPTMIGTRDRCRNVPALAVVRLSPPPLPAAAGNPQRLFLRRLAAAAAKDDRLPARSLVFVAAIAEWIHKEFQAIPHTLPL